MSKQSNASKRKGTKSVPIAFVPNSKSHDGIDGSSERRIRTLVEIATQVLIQYKEWIQDIGDCPRHLMEPVLWTLSPEQLYRLEYFNEVSVLP